MHLDFNLSTSLGHSFLNEKLPVKLKLNSQVDSKVEHVDGPFVDFCVSVLSFRGGVIDRRVWSKIKKKVRCN